MVSEKKRRDKQESHYLAVPTMKQKSAQRSRESSKESVKIIEQLRSTSRDIDHALSKKLE